MTYTHGSKYWAGKKLYICHALSFIYTHKITRSRKHTVNSKTVTFVLPPACDFLSCLIDSLFLSLFSFCSISSSFFFSFHFLFELSFTGGSVSEAKLWKGVFLGLTRILFRMSGPTCTMIMGSNIERPFWFLRIYIFSFSLIFLFEYGQETNLVCMPLTE